MRDKSIIVHKQLHFSTRLLKSVHSFCKITSQAQLPVIVDKSTFEQRHENPAFCICENKGADQLHGN